jgi:hypothetical protein
MNNTFKNCPNCQQPAILSMVACQRCGHRFTSAPTPSLLPIEPFPDSSVSVLRTTNWLLLGVILMLGVVAGFIYLHDRHIVTSKGFFEVGNIRSSSTIVGTA